MKKINYLAIAATAMLAVACGKSNNQEATSETAEEPMAVKVVGKEISYTADTTTMNGYLAYNENSSDKMPGIIVVHEWWGHNEYARERADMLAKLGYVAFAVDMYGDGQVAGHPEDAMTFAMSVMGNLEVGKARFDKAVETLKSQPNVDPDKIAAVGYCFGGSVAMTIANTGYDLDAVVAFHSGVQLPVMPATDSVKAKVLVCNGANDPFIPAEQVEAFKAAMDSANVDYEYIAYPGAVHSFTSKRADSIAAQFDMPLAYNEAADKQSWEAMQKLFAEVF